MSSGEVERKLTTILAADVVGYSRLTAADEEGTVRRLRAYREIIDGLVARYHGRVFGSAGDSAVAEFPSAVEAVRCAVDVQRSLAERNADLSEQERMQFRIGVNVGDVVIEGNNLLGDGVNVAARLEGLAQPGGVCISGTAYDQVKNKLPLGYADLGEQAVKNIPEPVRVYRVQADGWTPPVAPWRRRALPSPMPAVAIASLALVVTAVWLLTRGTDTGAPHRATQHVLPALPSGPAVAVLPFTNLSRDPEQEYFSDGLTENIITELSRFRDLFVIARNSTFRYKGRPLDVRELRRDLGARYVVEGSVRRSGNALRMSAQLIDAKDGTHLWAETYDRDLSIASIFEVQDQIAERVVGTIASRFGVLSRARFAEVKGKPTNSFTAYECVLLADAYYRDNYVRSEHEKVRRCLERAVREDPGYAGAWAYLTWIYLDEHRFGYYPRPDPLGRALRAAQRAVRADPGNQSAHLALAAARFYRHELDLFLAASDRAVLLNPNDAFTLAVVGEMLVLVGDARGIELVRRAIALDPHHPTWLNFPIAYDHFRGGEYEEALTAARKINIPGYFWPKVYLAAIYASLGREADAREAVAELDELYPGFTIETYRQEAEKENTLPEDIEQWVQALRKVGVPEEPAAPSPAHAGDGASGADR